MTKDPIFDKLSVLEARIQVVESKIDIINSKLVIMDLAKARQNGVSSGSKNFWPILTGLVALIVAILGGVVGHLLK